MQIDFAGPFEILSYAQHDIKDPSMRPAVASPHPFRQLTLAF